MLTTEAAKIPPRGSPEYNNPTPQSMIDEQVPSLSTAGEGFKGESSFQSHAKLAETALEQTLVTSGLVNVESTSAVSRQHVREFLRGHTNADGTTSQGTNHKPHTEAYDFEPGNVPLPSIEIVLKLLRLAKTEKQRFFLDVPLFTEDEFVDMCRGIYFAIGPISVWSWICVNVGLYFLFMDCSRDNCFRMSTTPEELRSYTPLLKNNAESAMQSLRLCSEPSMESCRALSLLVRYHGQVMASLGFSAD
jgi:hypothetical protein